jgi:hypothetical protein
MDAIAAGGSLPAPPLQPLPPEHASPGTGAGTIIASACVTLVFSRMKDFVLGRGEERRGGGRRRVVLEALRELTAAIQVRWPVVGGLVVADLTA